MKYLFLDDIRNPEQAILTFTKESLLKKTGTCATDWVVVRNYKDFCDHLKYVGIPGVISFDHDLGDFAMREFIEMEAAESNIFNYNSLNGEKTGLDCAKFLCKICLDKDRKIPTFFVHSFNPVGAQNIINILQ